MIRRSLTARALALTAAALALSACAPLGGAHRAHHDGRAAIASHPVGVAARLDPAALAPLGERLRADVAAGRIPGGVLMVAQHGRVLYTEAVGMRDPKRSAPMQVDSLFRIYSMTKPLVSVAAMMLVEEGRLRLDDPVSRHLPEFATMRVGIEKPGADGKPVLETVAARRAITVQDLLRHTSGLTYGVFGKSLVKTEYLKAGIHKADRSDAALAAEIARLPLQFEPGTVWEYSRSTDVLGALLERVEGMPLERILARRITGPLGMRDTAFSVEPAAHERIAEPFPVDRATGRPVQLSDVRKPPRFLGGGQGLVSTAADYMRFAQMLLDGGTLDGVRILSPRTIRFMTADHLGPIRAASLARGAAYSPGPGYGFGLGFAVRDAVGEAAMIGNPGEFYWGGYAGTYFWVDPRDRLVVVWMMQAPDARVAYRATLRSAVYAAMR